MYSEKEAKTKWCPFARVHQSVYDRELVMNRTDTDLPVGLCIASDCMAWRRPSGMGGLGFCGLARGRT